MDRGLLEFYLAEGSPLENDIFKNNPDKEFVRWSRYSCYKNCSEWEKIKD